MTYPSPPGPEDQRNPTPDPHNELPIEAYQPPDPTYQQQPSTDGVPQPPDQGQPQPPAYAYPPPDQGFQPLRPPYPTSPGQHSAYPAPQSAQPAPPSAHPYPAPESAYQGPGYPAPAYPAPDQAYPPPYPAYPPYPGQPYQAQPYATPAYQYGYADPYGYSSYQPHRPTDGLAIASMVVSCVAVPAALCTYGFAGLIGVLGAILGHVSQRRIRTTGASGAGMALAGIIVGWIAAGLGLLVGIAFVVLITRSGDFSSI
jgi:hypothetical protein